MKYRCSNEIIPMDSRKDINAKILYLIEQGTADKLGISKEDIFNAYSGDGGLHGLDFKDFNNFREYTEAKKEIENGQFFTPYKLCETVMKSLNISVTETVADLTAGIASFCNYMPVESNFYGCEIDIKSIKVSRYLYPNANLEHKDIRYYNPPIRFDYVVGNPPFNLKWMTENGEYLSQMYYCVKASELLKPLGIMAIVVPRSFLADDFSNSKMIKEVEDKFDFLGQVGISANAFKHLGVTDYPTKLMYWQKRLDDDTERMEYKTECSYFIEDLSNVDDAVNYISKNIVAEAKDRIEQSRIKLKKESVRSEDDPFYYTVNKMMYHIRTNPKLVDKYAKCQEYLYRYENERMPSDMKYEDWIKIRITKPKVIAYLRRVLKSQNQTEPKDEIALVKQDYNFVWKGYSAKSRKWLKDEDKIPKPIYSYVIDNELDVEINKRYGKLIRRKKKDYKTETKPWSDMSLDDNIAEWLNNLSFYDSENEEEIHLNNIQKNDLNLILQKKYSLLQWKQGSGKTLAGIAVGKYRMQKQNAKNVWVASTAISIKNNWDSVLDSYGIDYVLINRLKDINNIRDGQFVIITLNMLCKYRRQIKDRIKSVNQKVCFIFDESDEMSNPSSNRTKAVLDCFRRCKYKLAMTGTTTRNNISEIMPQFELLYNNSYNLMSWCYDIYSVDKKSGENDLIESSNPYYGKPIPAYREGYALFASSHLPEKITVFGVGQKTQDIYNSDVLKDILDYSIITRSFEEVSGKDICKLHQEVVYFSPAESAVYGKAISEFYSMRNNYFASTGNSRKDSMMKLIQQITLLLRISAAPNTVIEYNSTDTPVKINRVMEMLDRWNKEIVVIGVRHKNVVDAYANEIKKRYPDRKLFIVTGSTTTLAKRKALKKTLRDSRNGILLCTQQSLPSSVNFEFVNKIIIPELHYNNARMSQFYHRFIRYTSTDDKDIYFVTYANSIESNQMQMVLAKEKLNMFMKGRDVELDEIYEEFGIDYDLLSMLMTREKDEDGKFNIRWGKQIIA